MKKYFFGAVAIALAIGFSAFTTPKKVSTKALTHKFVFNGGTSVDANILAVASNRYSNWQKTTTATNQLCSPAQDLACVIELDAKYTHDYGGTTGRKINSSDPDGAGPEVAFTMTTANGIFTGGTQLRVVNNTTTTDVAPTNTEF